jgi:hypothetical protein
MQVEQQWPMGLRAESVALHVWVLSNAKPALASPLARDSRARSARYTFLPDFWPGLVLACHMNEISPEFVQSCVAISSKHLSF